jgi:hypothetical protein
VNEQLAALTAMIQARQPEPSRPDAPS